MKIFDETYIRNFLKQQDLPLFEKGTEWVHPKLFPYKNIGRFTQDQKTEFLAQFNDLGKKTGVYVYEQNGKIIYIGKATPFKERLKHHFLESYDIHKDAPVFWKLFFSDYRARGELNVYLIPLENSLEAKIIESFYQELYKPSFDQHLKRFQILSGRKNPRTKTRLPPDELKVYEDFYTKSAA